MSGGGTARAAAPGTTPATETTLPTVTEATPAQLVEWDALTVDPPGGHLYQSRAWAAYRAAIGWRPRFLALSDGGRVLVLERPWPIVGGASAYVSRGPAPTSLPVATLAARLAAVSDYLAAHGVDVVAADAEVPAETGYGELLAARGFRPIEELQPSRHRMDLVLGPGADEAAVFRAFSMSHRQRIRQAEREGLVVLRLDRVAPAGEGEALAGGALAGPGAGCVGPSDDPFDSAEAVIGRLHALVRLTGERRHFSVGPADAFLDWSLRALAARRLVLLECRTAEGEPVAAASFYRHGERLTYSHSGDRTELRSAHPGAVRLILWRLIQLAIAEGRAIVDLGGVDVAGARRMPRPGEPAHGLLEFKRGFGASWVELTGARERVVRPARYAIGRVAARASRVVGR